MSHNQRITRESANVSIVIDTARSAPESATRHEAVCLVRSVAGLSQSSRCESAISRLSI